MITIALIDDHALIRNALKQLINGFGDYTVTLDAANGQEFIEKLRTTPIPQIVLVDINMPILNGYDTASYITEHFPDTKIIALSVNDDDESIIRMLRCGAVGYLLKDSETEQLREALEQVLVHGFYHNELTNSSLLKSLKTPESKAKPISIYFQSREEEFLKLVCTELTYKEIANQMHLSPRTIDGYRESLFEKLSIKSRVGLVMFAIRNSIVVI